MVLYCTGGPTVQIILSYRWSCTVQVVLLYRWSYCTDSLVLYRWSYCTGGLIVQIVLYCSGVLIVQVVSLYKWLCSTDGSTCMQSYTGVKIILEQSRSRLKWLICNMF